MAGNQRPDVETITQGDDQFPTLEKGLRQVLKTTPHGDTQIRRIDIRFGAGGDGYYRIWEGRDVDPQAGVAPKS